VSEWLSNLPANWHVADPRRHFRDRREVARSDDAHLTPSQHMGVLTQAEYMERTGSRVVLNLSAPDHMKHVEPGDFIAHLRSFQGGLERSGLRGKVSTAYTVIAPDDSVHGPFYRWVLKSAAFISALSASLEQLRDGQSVKFKDFAAIPLPLPPMSEQRRITEFLDDRVARIDQIIAARELQRRVLAQSTSSRLQEMQDAWAERHGETRLGRVLLGLEQGWSPQAESTPAAPDEWGVMRSGCVNDGIFRESDNKRLPDILDPRREYELRPGDLLVSRASGSLDKIGSAAVVPSGVRGRLLLCDKIYRLTPLRGWDPHFIAPMLRTHRNRELIRLGVSGAEGMANNLPSGVIRGLMVPLVPQAQQASFAGAMANLEKRSRVADEALMRSVSLLQEYKQSLITAAVTGELDVTTACSGVPG